MVEVFFILLVLLSITINISSLDDAFIDLLALGINYSETTERISLVGNTSKIGVMIANWHEEDILEKMIEGNLKRVIMPDVIFYLGVYPNDSGTRLVAENLHLKYPSRIHVVVNSLDGPTSKGQMLNEMFACIHASNNRPNLYIMHDSEDIIDKREFYVFEKYAEFYDFIQGQVFSLNTTKRSLVAASYMDEFVERHTSELVVRSALESYIPSAGVGTCLTHNVIDYFINTRGSVFLDGCVTEDYILGLETKRAGFKCKFVSASHVAIEGRDFVATREFFPKTLNAAIKQKTRWIYGINFEATHKLGWEGNFWDKYFMIHDRKGTITNFLLPFSWILFFLLFSDVFQIWQIPTELENILYFSFILNLFFLSLRFVVRVQSTYTVYGILDPFGIIVRWPVSLFINTLALINAWIIYLSISDFCTKPITWSKTDHEVPDDFTTANR